MAQRFHPICTVLVVDPHPMAHVPFIHAATLACLTSLGMKCISLSVQCQEIRHELDGLLQRGEVPSGDLELVQWDSIPHTSGSSWADLDHALRPWMQAQADPESTLVWIGWLDYLVGKSRKSPCLPDWPWFWAGAYYLLPPSFQSGPRFSSSWFKERVLPFWRFLGDRRCRGLAVLDEYWLADAKASRLNTFFRSGIMKLTHFPDVASTHHSGTFGMALDRAGRIRIGLLGQLSWRKGVVPFLKAACMAEDTNPDLEFLLAGELKIDQFSVADRDFVLSTLRDPPGNLHFISGPFPDEAQFNALVNHCDVIHVAYSHFPGSSNLLAKAAAFRIPVIARPGQLIGRRVQNYALGWITSGEGLEDFLQVISSVNPTELNRIKSQARWQDFLAMNDLAALRSMFMELLRSRV